MINKISNFHETQMSGIMEALKPTKEVFGLNGKEEMLANKEAEQDSKGIDWGEFDQLDQIIFDSTD